MTVYCKDCKYCRPTKRLVSLFFAENRYLNATCTHSESFVIKEPYERYPQWEANALATVHPSLDLSKPEYREQMSCITARMIEECCGPDAKLFEPKAGG